MAAEESRRAGGSQPQRTDMPGYADPTTDSAPRPVWRLMLSALLAFSVVGAIGLATMLYVYANRPLSLASSSDCEIAQTTVTEGAGQTAATIAGWRSQRQIAHGGVVDADLYGTLVRYTWYVEHLVTKDPNGPTEDDLRRTDEELTGHCPDLRSAAWPTR
jgi:hypothetical protein